LTYAGNLGFVIHGPVFVTIRLTVLFIYMFCCVIIS